MYDVNIKIACPWTIDRSSDHGVARVLHHWPPNELLGVFWMNRRLLGCALGITNEANIRPFLNLTINIGEYKLEERDTQ